MADTVQQLPRYRICSLFDQSFTGCIVGKGCTNKNGLYSKGQKKYF